MSLCARLQRLGELLHASVEVLVCATAKGITDSSNDIDGKDPNDSLFVWLPAADPYPFDAATGPEHRTAWRILLRKDDGNCWQERRK
jgi:hypothetical protein